MNAQANLLRQHYAHAMTAVDELDKQLDNLKARVLDDLRALKNGEITLAQITISDNDYEVIPAKPEIVRNGAKEEPVAAHA